MTRVTMLVSGDGGRMVKVAHPPMRSGKPTSIAVKPGDAPATDVSYTPVSGGRRTLFAVGETRLGDALLDAVKERPVVAEVDRGRAVVTLPGVKWRSMARRP